MVMITVDACGLKCPQPILKLTAAAPTATPGDVMEVVADCATFPRDIAMWCARTKRTLLFCRDEGGGKHRAQVQF
jgi:TusA-related sulfurtransferase